jgi:rubrerythrin
MQESKGELRCTKVGMGLSLKLREGLEEVFVRRSRPGRLNPPTFPRVGGPWFCPGCGTAMRVDSPHVTCPSCGNALDEFLYPIVELHPHIG